MKDYYVALPLTAELYQQIISLSQRFNAGEKTSLSNEAGRLLADVGCQVVEHVFGELVKNFAHHPDLAPQKRQVFQESLTHIEDVQGVMRKYMAWSLSWFSNERLTPVINYFVQQIRQENHAGNTQYYLTFELPQDVGERALLALASLEDGKVDNAEGAIESLIEVTDIGVTQLIREPQARLKFNFVTEKTLNGVTKVTASMAYNNLRKFAKHLDPQLFKAFAGHLEQFLKVK